MTEACSDCGVEYASPDELARHRATVHGLSASSGTPFHPEEPVETASARPAPPWDSIPASADTTWRSQAIDDPPSQPEAGAARSAAGTRLGGFPKPPTTVLVAVGLAVALIIGMVAVSGHGGGKSAGGQGQVAVTLPAVSSTTTPSRSLRLDSAVVTAADLGGGWSPLTPAKALRPDEYTQGACGSALWAKDTSGYGSAFQEGSGQYAHRVVESTVLQAPSNQVADQQREFIASPSFVPCVKQVVASNLVSALPAAEQPEINQLTADPLNLTLNVPVTGYVVTIGVTLFGGRIRVVFTDDVIVVFTGRYMGTLEIAWCSCTPGGQELVGPQTSLLVQRLAALPPDLASGTSA